MDQPLHIHHPFVERVLAHDDGFTVSVKPQVPIKPFRVWRTPDIWPGHVEMAGEVGIRDLDGQITWLHGGGTSVEEAVQDLLVQLLNLVVDPQALRDTDVVYRDKTPPSKSLERTRDR